MLMFYLQSHVLLSLRIKSRVDDQTVDKQPNMVSNLVSLYNDTTLIFFVYGVLERIFNKFANVLYVTTSFGSCNGVDKGHLQILFI